MSAPRKALEQYAVRDWRFLAALCLQRGEPGSYGSQYLGCWFCVRARVCRCHAPGAQTERVTPILGKLIENIMAERPADPAQYIVRYLTKSDSMAASAAHWDALTAELAAATKKTPEPPQEEDSERSIPIETFKAISSALDPFEAQERVIAESCHLLSCDRASIFLLDETTNELVLHVAKGAQEIRIPRTAGIAGECASKGAVLTINDPYNDPRFNQATGVESGPPPVVSLCPCFSSLSLCCVCVLLALCLAFCVSGGGWGVQT